MQGVPLQSVALKTELADCTSSCFVRGELFLEAYCATLLPGDLLLCCKICNLELIDAILPQSWVLGYC